MGTNKIGKYDFVIRSSHMVFFIVFSTLRGHSRKAWKGPGRRTIRVENKGLAGLNIPVFMGVENYIRQFE